MWRQLVECGLLPADAPNQRASLSGVDIAHTAVELWQASSLNAPSWMETLAARVNQGHRLLLMSDRHASWIGHRMMWLPPTISKTIGIASSRLGRVLEDQPRWFDAFRTVCANAARQDATLISIEATTASRFVRRAAGIFGANYLEIELPKTKENLADWVARSVSTQSASVSPIVVDNDNAGSKQIPLADRVLFCLSEQLIALQVRNNSTTLHLLNRRLQDQRFTPGSVFIAANDELVAENVRHELLDCGAVGWFLFGSDQASPDQITSMPGQAHVSNAEIIPTPSPDDGQFLTHCTRRRDGPWPDEVEDRYVEDLVLGHSAANHSALSALSRIVSQKKLIASGECIRGNFPVVSFTEIPLSELAERRIYRSHRGRWDFEPYGISIRRDWFGRQRS